MTLNAMLAGIVLYTAISFASFMQRLKVELALFYETRRHFLADPAQAAALHCSAERQQLVCHRTVEIRKDGLWQDVCPAVEPSVFRIERFYRLQLDCRSHDLIRFVNQIPRLQTLVKR